MNHPSKPTETIELLPSGEHSNGKNCGTRARDMGPTRGIGHLKLTIPLMANVSSERTGAPNIFTQWVKKPPGSPVTQKWMPLPGFVEIARSLQGDDSPHINHQCTPGTGSTLHGGIYCGNEQDGPGHVGMTTIDTMTCQLNVMGLGSAQPSPTISISKMPPSLEGASELEDWSWLQPPPSGFTDGNTMFPHHWQLSALILHYCW